MSDYQWVDGVTVTLRNHEYYRTEEDVLDKIRENEKEIARLKTKLFAMICGNPKDLFANTDIEGEQMNIIDVAEREFIEIMNEEFYGLEALIAHNVDLWYVYNNFDKQQNEWDR